MLFVVVQRAPQDRRSSFVRGGRHFGALLREASGQKRERDEEENQEDDPHLP